MPEKHPIDDLFDQFRSLLKLIEDHSDTPADEIKIPPDFEQKLAQIEKKVEQFSKLSEDIVRLSGVPNEEIKMRLQGVSDQVPSQGKELINKSHSVKRQAEVLEDQIDKVFGTGGVQMERAQPSVPEEKSERSLTEKEKAKKRRSKFKRFGGDDKWKPL